MSNNLDLDQVAAHQAASEVTINDQAGQLDAALTESLEILVGNDNAATLTASELQRHNYFLLSPGSPAATALVTITLPAVVRGLFVVQNSTGQDVEISIPAQTWPVVEMADGEVFVLHADGTDCRAVGGGGGVDLGAITDQYLLYNNGGVVGGLPQNTFVKADGSVSMTGTLNISTAAGRNVAIRSISTTIAELATEATYWYFTTDDGEGGEYTYALGSGSAGFAPQTDNLSPLGITSLRWVGAYIGTDGVDSKGHVKIDNQKELQLYETDANGANYSAFRAPAALAGTTTFTLPDGDAATAGSFMETDAAGTLSWKQPPYDFAGFFAGAPGNGELITRIVANRTVVMPQNLTGSQGYISVAATASTVFDIQVNGVSKGSMTFAAAGTVATFTFATAVTLVAGDLLSIVGPNPADASAANLSFSLKCYRTN